MDKTAFSTDEIFRQAIQLSDDTARRQFVDQSCQSDPELRAEIEARLKLHFRRGDTLEETTDGLGKNLAASGVPKVGSRIGPYLLVEEIGEGGMGIVFLAEQSEPMRRKVALKVIKIGMDTRRVVARFEAEQQTMALLDHPCITKVLDAGATDSGRPFFVMELVQGQPITKYCDEHRFSVRRRLEVFIQVCNALEHAHQKGIIHRDIKPTNIMVTDQDGAPLPKIIDFGIAKATAGRNSEQTSVTRMGEMVGTPLYMSPEQADANEADIDTRSDIYSLGVLLYELVTGTTPFYDLKKSSINDIRAAIRSQDPPTASSRVNSLRDTVVEISSKRGTDARSLYKSIRGELDWILTKCLARDRNQRYQSAGELAREIHRFMNGEALDAAAPTLWYRTTKFVKRNRVAVGVTVLAASLLAFVSVFSSWMAVQANDLAVRANDLAKRATTAEKLATSRLAEVIEQRDRAIAAEKRLAQLEREQRNRVAIHQATALYNADMMKRYMQRARQAGDVGEPGGMQFVPLASLLDGSQPRPPQPNIPGQPIVEIPQPPAAIMGHAGIMEADAMVSAARDDDDLQIVMCEDEQECQASLLKNILKQQKAAFGENDVMVAVTLNKLGELMSKQENWGESAEYFNEAMEILKDTAEEHPELLRIRSNLAKVINNQGDVKQAIAELEAAKKTLGEVDFRKASRLIWDKVKERVDKKKPQGEDEQHK